MTTEQILAQLRDPGPEIPREALAEVVRRPDEFVPLLLAEIETATRLAAAADPNDNLPSFALYLLAELREPRALEPILAYFALDGTTEEELFGDIIVQDGSRILAAVAQHHPERLRAYGQRRDLSLVVRAATFDALVLQVLWGEQPRETVVACFTELFESRAFGTDVDAWTVLVAACMDFHPREFLQPIRRLFERDLVDPVMIGDFEEVEEEAAEDSATHHQRHAAYHRPITDTAEAVAWWQLFEPPSPMDPFDPLNHDWEPGLQPLPPSHDWEMDPIDLPSPDFDLPAVPIRHETPKTGRNDLCPCGSGKKYKKCCLPAG